MTTKVSIQFFLFLFLSLTALSQPNWSWAKGTVCPNPDYPTYNSVDSVGNSYVVGDFSGFSITLGSITLTSSGSDNLFVAKYDPSGNVLWAKCPQGVTDCFANSVSSDKQGNICVTGSFSTPTLILDNDTLINHNSSGTSSDIFLAKFDSSGNVIWAKCEGGLNFEYQSVVFLDNSGNSYWTGMFASPLIVFGSDTLFNSNVSGNIPDIFIAKLDVNGNVIWAKREGGAQPELCNGIQVDGSGNIFITGSFQDPSITFGAFTITNGGVYGDIFLVKYDGSGNVLWAKGATGSSGDDSYSVSVDKLGNSYISGQFQSPSLYFGSISLSNSSGFSHVFIAKYDPMGNIKWAKTNTGTSSDYGICVSNDNFGNCYFSGSFDSPTFTLGSTSLVNSDNSGNTFDGFVAKYDSLGTLLWALKIGGSANASDAPVSLDIDAFNVCYVAGYFDSPTLALGSNLLTNSATTFSYEDMFVARLEDPLSVPENEISNKLISVFPNPSTEIFHFDGVTELMEVDIYDSFGKFIKSQLVSPANCEIDFHGMSSGIYLAKFFLNGEPFDEQRLVKID